MEIKFNNSKLELKVREVKGLGIIRGLMFRRRENAPILLFNLRADLHSFFVFFSFLVLWLNEKNEVIDWKVTKPFSFRINSKTKYYKIVEIPISRRYNSEVTFIVGKRFKKKLNY